MSTKVNSIAELARKFGLSTKTIPKTVGIKLSFKEKVLRSIKNEIKVVESRKDTKILKVGKKSINEVRFYRHLEGNELEVCVKYKGKKVVVENEKEGIVIKNDYKLLLEALNVLYEMYNSIDEDDDFYVGRE
jgi:hypothetical protein